METRPPRRLGRWTAAVLEVPRVWLDRDLRVRMTDLGYSVLRGDLDAAVEGLEEIERSARSRAVRGWANAGLAFALLASSRWDDAQRVAERHPDLDSQPLLALTLELRGGRLDPRFARALADCTFAVAAAGAVRAIVAMNRLGDVIAQVTESPPEKQALALLALQMGLHVNRDHAGAIQVGELVHQRAKEWDISAYWVAGDQAAIGDHAAALTWLNHAADAGFSAVADLDKDSRFDPIRSRPDFAAVRRRMLANPTHPADTRHGGLLWAGVRR
jgi:hypothetical protein